MATGVQRLFVGGLTCSTSEEEIGARLSRFGELSNIKLAKKDSVNGGQDHCFAHLNFHGDAEQLKKLISTFHETRWKGNTIRIEKAKADFMDKLVKEREMEAKAELAVSKKGRGDQLMENFQKAGVENFTMRRVVPGTAVTGEKNWVVGKYGRVLPVVYLRTKDKRKISKYDPSKYIHHLKQIKEDASSSTKDISLLSWRTGDEEEVFPRNGSILNGTRKLRGGPIKRKLDSGEDTGILAKNRKGACNLPSSGDDRRRVSAMERVVQPGREAHCDRSVRSSGTKDLELSFTETEPEVESDRDSADTDEICFSKNKKGSSTVQSTNVAAQGIVGGKLSKRELDGRTLLDTGGGRDLNRVVKDAQSMDKSRSVTKQQKEKNDGYSFKFFESNDPKASGGDSQDSSSDMESDDSSQEGLSTENRPNKLGKGSQVSDKSSENADSEIVISGSNIVGIDRSGEAATKSEPKEKRKRVSFNENVLLHQQGETALRPLEVPDEDSDVDVDDLLDKEKEQYESLNPDDIIASIVQEMKVKKALHADSGAASGKKVPVGDGGSQPDQIVICSGEGDMKKEVSKEEGSGNATDTDKSVAEDTLNKSGMSLKLNLLSLSGMKRPETDGASSGSAEEELEDGASSVTDNDDVRVPNVGKSANDADHHDGVVLEDVREPDDSERERESNSEESNSPESEADEPEDDTSSNHYSDEKDQTACTGKLLKRIGGKSGVDQQNKYSGNKKFELLVLDKTILAKDGIGVQGVPSESFLGGGNEDVSRSSSSEESDDGSSSDSDDGGKRVVQEFRGMTHFRNQLKNEDTHESEPVGKSRPNKYSGCKGFEFLVLDKTMLPGDNNCGAVDEPAESLPKGDDGIAKGSPPSEESDDTSGDTESEGHMVVQEFKGMDHFRNEQGQKHEDSSGDEGKMKDGEQPQRIVGFPPLGNADLADIACSDELGDEEVQSMKEVTRKVHHPGNDDVQQGSKCDGSVRDQAGKSEKQKPARNRTEEDYNEKKLRRLRNQEGDNHKEDGEIFGFHQNKYSGNPTFDLLLLDGSVKVKQDNGDVQESLSKNLPNVGGGEVSNASSSDDSSIESDSELGGDRMIVEEFKGMGHFRNHLGDVSDVKTTPATQDSSESSGTEEESGDTENVGVCNPGSGTGPESREGDDVKMNEEEELGATEMRSVRDVPLSKVSERDADDETSSTESSDDQNTKPKRKKKCKRKQGDKTKSNDDEIPPKVGVITTVDSPTSKTTVSTEEDSAPPSNPSQKSSKRIRREERADGVVGAECEKSEEASREGGNTVRMVGDGRMNGEAGVNRRRKRDKPKRKKVKGEDSSKLANERRLQAVKERAEEMKEKQMAIKKALSSVDSVQKTEDKHMRFDSSSEEHGPPSDGSHGGLDHAKIKETISLFKDDDDDGDDSSSDRDRFKSKPQFEGEKGAKLLKMQDAFGDDPRFNLDERFAEDDHSEDGNEQQIHLRVGEAHENREEEVGEDFESEKAKSLSILENVLGVMLPRKRSTADEKKTKFRDVNQIKFDPSREDHSKFVLTPVQSNTKKKKKSAVKESLETPMPEVSRETFADFQPDLKSAFSQEEPVTFSFFSGGIEEERTSQKIDEVGEATPLPAAFDKEKLPWDSSDSEDDRGEDVDASKSIQASQHSEAPTIPTQTRSFFFSNSDDHRLASGIGRFCRSQKEDIKDGWTETKTEMLIASTKRHQKALRDSQRMPRKRPRPSTRRRIGKKF